MMAQQIVKSAQPYYLQKTKPVKRGPYLAFIHKLPCMMTGTRQNIEAAHLSFASTRHGHYGRGKGTKVSDRWCLPLSSEAHKRQHSMSEPDFWRGRDPHTVALAIFGLWLDLGDDAEEFAASIIFQSLAAAGQLRDRNQA
jgi:hypothetical protein